MLHQLCGKICIVHLTCKRPILIQYPKNSSIRTVIPRHLGIDPVIGQFVITDATKCITVDIIATPQIDIATNPLIDPLFFQFVGCIIMKFHHPPNEFMPQRPSETHVSLQYF